MKTKIDKLIRKRQRKIEGNVAKHRRICGGADGASLGFFLFRIIPGADHHLTQSLEIKFLRCMIICQVTEYIDS